MIVLLYYSVKMMKLKDTIYTSSHLICPLPCFKMIVHSCFFVNLKHVCWLEWKELSCVTGYAQTTTYHLIHYYFNNIKLSILVNMRNNGLSFKLYQLKPL